MSNKPKRAKLSYRVVGVQNGTYTVEARDGTKVITQKKGFPNKATADAWIAGQKLVGEAKPPR